MVSYFAGYQFHLYTFSPHPPLFPLPPYSLLPSHSICISICISLSLLPSIFSLPPTLPPSPLSLSSGPKPVVTGDSHAVSSKFSLYIQFGDDGQYTVRTHITVEPPIKDTLN